MKSFHFIVKNFLFVFLLCSGASVFGQVRVISSAGTTVETNYTKLSDAFIAINAGTHQGAILVRLIGISAANSTIAETVTCTLYSSGTGSSSYSSINIFPDVSVYNLSSITLSFGSSLNAAGIELNGADNVTIDGRSNRTGSVSNLTIIHTRNSNTPALISFSNDATFNTVRYCTLKASMTTANSSIGILVFKNPGTSTGNSNNTISNNSFTNNNSNNDAANAARPINCIYALGLSGKENRDNTISDNNFFNFFNRSTTTIVHSCINIGNYNSAYTISGNSFYDRIQFVTQGTTISSYIVININIDSSESGNGFRILNNYIGGNAPYCGGSAWLKSFNNDPGVNTNNSFTGIYLKTKSGTASSCQGNMIKNITWSNWDSSSTAAIATFTGIEVSGATNVDIGSIAANNIGASSATGNISLIGATANVNNYGIKIASTGYVSCKNDSIGSISIASKLQGNANNFYGIYVDSTSATASITNNFIGSADSYESIYCANAALDNPQWIYGIYSKSKSPINISGNVINNLTNRSTSATTTLSGGTIGIYAKTSSADTITNNVIKNLDSRNSNAFSSDSASVIGIMLKGAASVAQNISGNTISNLKNINSSFTGSVIGLYYDGPATTSNISKNFINSLSVNASTSAANIYGIKVNGGSSTYSNNIISLAGTTNSNVFGMYEKGGSSSDNSLLFNTVYIGGSQVSGASNQSYCLYSNASNNNRIFKNNIFHNARSTASGSNAHYAAYFNYGASANLALDYNDYYVSGTGGTLGYYNGNNMSTLPIVTGMDGNSLSRNPVFTNEGGLTPSSYLPAFRGLVAATGTGITTDYVGSVTRSVIYPSMGAYEYTVCLIPSAPMALGVNICYGSAATLSATGTGTLGWYSAATGGNYLGSGSSFTTPALTASTTYYIQDSSCIESESRTPVVVTVNTAKTWVGGTGVWNLASNWCGGLPLSTDNIVISSGNPNLDTDFTVAGTLTISGTGGLTINPSKTLTISGTADFGDRAVTVKSDITGTGSIGKITGTLIKATNVTVERYIPNNSFRAWRLLSVPTYGSGQTINGAWQEGNVALGNTNPGYGAQITNTFSGSGFDAVSPSASLTTFNGTSFTPVSSTNIPINTYKNYFMYVRGDRSVGVNTSTTTNSATTLRTTGTIYQGDQVTETIPANSFGVVGNPYPSAIDFTALTLAGGINKTFYIWDAKIRSGNSLGAYQTFNSTTNYQCTLGGGSFELDSSNTIIQSGQAFFVKAGTSAGNIIITESSKVSSNGNLGYKLTSELVKLDSRLYSIASSGTTMADANVVVFDSAYANDVNDDDAAKFANAGENLGMLRNGKTLVVEGRKPLSSSDTIYFRMWNMQPHDYRFEFVPQNLGSQNLTARLEDSYLNTSTIIDLGNTTNVDFTVNSTPGSYSSNRFRIVFNPTVVLPVNFRSISANRKASNVQVNWKVDNEINIVGYEIERSSNGIKFEKIGTESHIGAVNYYFTDLGAPKNTVFYRIKSMGVSGEIAYSAIAKVSEEISKPDYTIVPNPVEGHKAFIQFKNQADGMYQLILVNGIGQQVVKTMVTHSGGNSTQTVSLPPSLESGTYQLEIIAPDSSISTQTLVIKK